MQIQVSETGIDEAMRELDPRRAQEVMIRWFDRGTKYVRSELRNQAPKSLKAKVKIMTDRLIPPKWARIFVKSPVAHLIEGGTGALGASGFKHVARHWPSTKGIMEQTGLPQAQAFMVARTIGMRGGNPPRPFIKPTFDIVHGRVEQMAQEIAEEVYR